MKYCKTCDIHYDTPIDHCLFCQGDLVDESNQELAYKFTPVKKKKKPNQWLRFFVLLNIGSILITLGLDIIDGMPLDWSFTVSAANLFAIVFALMFFSHSIWSTKLNKLMVTTIIGTFLIGLSLKDYHWALDYVFPLVVIVEILILSSVILFNHRKWLDVSINLLFMSFVGLIPGLLFILNITIIDWPSIACLAYSVVTLIGIFFIPSKENREEFKSRFHV